MTASPELVAMNRANEAPARDSGRPGAPVTPGASPSERINSADVNIQQLEQMLGGDQTDNGQAAPQHQPETGPTPARDFDWTQDAVDDGHLQLQKIFEGETAAPAQVPQDQPPAAPAAPTAFAGLDIDAGAPPAQTSQIDQLTATVNQMAQMMAAPPQQQAAPQPTRAAIPQTDQQWIQHIQANQPQLDMEDPAQVMAYQNAVYLHDMRGQNAELQQAQQRRDYEAHVSQATAQYQPHVDATLAKYGEVPAATRQKIAQTAAAYQASGYNQQQSLVAAIQPYREILGMLTAAPPAAPAPQSRQPAAQAAPAQQAALHAVATGGQPNAAGRSMSFGATPEERIRTLENIVGG